MKEKNLTNGAYLEPIGTQKDNPLSPPINRRELEEWAMKRWKLLKTHYEKQNRGTITSILTWERLTDHYVWMEKLGLLEE